MQGSSKYANDCLWPKADIETESKCVFLNVRFGEKSGHSALNPCGVIGITEEDYLSPLTVDDGRD